MIAAIEEDNEDVIVEDFMVYKKVKAPGKMVFKRETVEEHLGADFDMDQVHILCLHASVLLQIGMKNI